MKEKRMSMCRLRLTSSDTSGDSGRIRFANCLVGLREILSGRTERLSISVSLSLSLSLSHAHTDREKHTNYIQDETPPDICSNPT